MKRILCYGDSNTYGYRPEWMRQNEKISCECSRFDEKERWTMVLQKLLGQEYRIIEEGLPGRTTVYDDIISPFLNGKAMFLPVIMSQSPIDLVIVMLGTNDLKTSFFPSECTLQMAMEEFLKTIKNPYIWENMKIPKILLISPPSLRDNMEQSPFYGIYSEESVRLSKKLGQIYEKVSLNYGCFFMNADDYVKTSDMDCIHMDVKNHNLLAQFVKEKIEKIL